VVAKLTAMRSLGHRDSQHCLRSLYQIIHIAIRLKMGPEVLVRLGAVPVAGHNTVGWDPSSEEQIYSRWISSQHGEKLLTAKNKVTLHLGWVTGVQGAKEGSDVLFGPIEMAILKK
jgi:hypothetical protein